MEWFIEKFGMAGALVLLVLALAMPLALIWAINTLTGAVILEYTLKNWAAILIVQMVLEYTFKGTK